MAERASACAQRAALRGDMHADRRAPVSACMARRCHAERGGGLALRRLEDRAGRLQAAPAREPVTLSGPVRRPTLQKPFSRTAAVICRTCLLHRRARGARRERAHRPRARTTSGRRLSTTTSRSTSRRRTAPPSTAATAVAVYPMPKRPRRSRARAHIATSSSFPCICFDRCLSRGGVETPMPPQNTVGCLQYGVTV